MNSVADHYSQLLAPIYSWMSGSVEAALEAGKAEIGEALQQLPAGALVVDLGAINCLRTSGADKRQYKPVVWKVGSV